MVTDVVILAVAFEILSPAVGIVGVGSESDIGDVYRVGVVLEIAGAAAGFGSVGVEALVHDVSLRGVVVESVLVTSQVMTIPPERVDPFHNW